MKKIQIYLLCCLINACGLLTLYAQPTPAWECQTELDPNNQVVTCPSGEPEFSPNGMVLTPKGTLRFLVVYAGFIGFEGDMTNPVGDQPSLDKWDNEFSNEFQLPSYLSEAADGSILSTSVFFNKESDFDPGGLMDDPNNQSASKILNLMSKPNEDFKFIGSVFTDANDDPILVTLDPVTLPTSVDSWREMNRQVAERMMDIRPLPEHADYWSQFNNRENYPDFCFDNSDTNTHPADDILDFVVYYYRYSPNWKIPGTQTLLEPIAGMKGWQGSGGGFYATTITNPSTNIGGLGFHHGFCAPIGVDNTRLFLHEFAHGLYEAAHVCGVNGAFGDYFKLGSTGLGLTSFGGFFEPVMSAWERAYMGFIDPIDVTTNQVIPLGDFITTGDAIRVEIPHSGGQRLWIENHTRQHVLDNHIYNGVNIDATIVTNSDPGIYMYVEDIATDLNDVYIFTPGSNGLKMINPVGNHDAQLDLSLPPVLNSWMHVMLQYETLDENPIGGTNPWFRYLYDFKGGTNGGLDDEIFYNTGTNSNGGAGEGEIVRREKINGQDVTPYRSFGVNGNIHTTAFEEGDALSMGTNPTIINYPKFDLANDRVEPYFLNGLKVEVGVSDPATGVVYVNVSFNETLIENDVRWTGDIHLPDITNSAADDLILDDDREITLDLSKVANRTISPPGENDFVNPTTFTIESGSKLHLEDRARIRVKNNSTLIIEE